MKMAIIGGGPGGLFLAGLAKRDGTADEVTLFERNAPSATFGFGVVFSDRTTRSIQEADPQTHEEMQRASVRWEDIEVRHPGRVLRCAGNGFTAIARVTLLEILQRRAQELGAELVFNHDVDDPASLEGYDVMVVGDGVNSRARAKLAGALRPRIAVGSAKYIWFATTQTFDALTFLLVENEHGRFSVHAYPFAEGRSTFIVETDEESWHRAGLDRIEAADLPPGESDLESMAYCEQLFAEHLGGHPLLANNSKWSNFQTIRCARWHAGTTVLLGDAVHTAHFSVGSGTKMAMEDAVALNHALRSRPTITQALQDYEAVRQPRVAHIQDAAEPSRWWWERFGQRMQLPAEQFAFHFLTRTGLVSLSRLRSADPGFVCAVEAWFERDIGLGLSGHSPSPLFAPLDLRGLRLANRLVSVPGAFDNAHLARVADLLLVRGPDDQPQLVDAARASGAKVGLLLAPPWPAGPPPEDGQHRLAELAREGAASGFDLAILDLCPSWTARHHLGQDRVDVLQRFVELFVAVRQAWPAERPLGVYLPAGDGREAPPDFAEVRLELAARIVERGCDLVGVASPAPAPAPAPAESRSRLQPAGPAALLLLDRLRNELNVCTLLVGGVASDDEASTLILAGRVDLCSPSEPPRVARPPSSAKAVAA